LRAFFAGRLAAFAAVLRTGLRTFFEAGFFRAGFFIAFFFAVFFLAMMVLLTGSGTRMLPSARGFVPCPLIPVAQAAIVSSVA
jgi:hypothetical protein